MDEQLQEVKVIKIEHFNTEEEIINKKEIQNEDKKYIWYENIRYNETNMEEIA